MKEKEKLVQFLQEQVEDWQIVLERFEKYHSLLWETNQNINLISRKMPEDEYWTIHYLDSLLPLSWYKDWNQLRVLDFGTGGGLPGLPIKLVYPEMEIHFLDSIHKKVNALEEIARKLDLRSCNFICSRIEDLTKGKWRGYFDRIICRSVRIEQPFVRPLLNLLKPNGTIILYKGRQMEDADLFLHKKIRDVSREELGERKLIEIRKA